MALSRSCRLIAAAEYGWHWLSSKAACSSAWRSGRHRQDPEGGRRDATTPHIPYMEVHPRVADAIASGFPVVAMETTIVTHGMPYPENLKYDCKLPSLIVKGTLGSCTVRVHHFFVGLQLKWKR